MPWTVVKVNDHKYNIVKSDTGEVVGSSKTRAEAEASIRARYANE